MGTRLVVATYNIRRAVGRDGRQTPERIARVLKEIEADVVALQEIAYRIDPIENVLEYLASATGATAVDGSTLRDHRGPYGNGLLCKLEIARVQRIDISKRGREPRGALDVDLTVEGRCVQVVATHLGLWPGERREQVGALRALLDRSDTKAQLLLGDFNEWLPWGRPLRTLRRLFGESPAPATFPAYRPRFALDRVWARPAGTIRGVHAHASEASRMASDHLPLVAELELDE